MLYKAVTLCHMHEPTREKIVVSVGGSLIVPEQIDTNFLSRFKASMLQKVQQGYTFTIIAGGGKTARRYMEAASIVTPLSPQDLDWIGIHSTRLNAQLLRNIFAGYVHPQVIKNPMIDVDTDEPILIASGWQPGHSTDHVAVLMAKMQGAKRLINLSNIDHVYDKDPNKYKDAKKIEKIKWPEFRKLIPDRWDPGLSSPFDPVAAKEAQALSLEVAVLNGARLDDFSKYLDGEEFIGTVIS